MATSDDFKLDKSKLNLDLLIRAGLDTFIRTECAFEAVVLVMSMSAISARTCSANLQAVANIETLYVRICWSTVFCSRKNSSRNRITRFIFVYYALCPSPLNAGLVLPSLWNLMRQQKIICWRNQRRKVEVYICPWNFSHIYSVLGTFISLGCIWCNCIND